MITRGADTKDLIRLMNILRGYVKTLGASVLVLGPPPPVSAYSAVSWTPNRTIAEFLTLADSLLSLERSRVIPSAFYIRDLRKMPVESDPHTAKVELFSFEDCSVPNFVAMHSEPEFLHNFKRPRHLSMLRRSIAGEMYGSGKSISEIARSLGVTRHAVQKMLGIEREKRQSPIMAELAAATQLLRNFNKSNPPEPPKITASDTVNNPPAYTGEIDPYRNSSGRFTTNRSFYINY